MKQSESNPLQQQLARMPLAGPHPDADLLTAFAEGTLLKRERQEVFTHLATCADCRELLSLATGAAEGPDARPKPFLVERLTHVPMRARIAWAGVAAGVLLACSAGLLYRHESEPKRQATIADQHAPLLPSAAIQQPNQHPPLAKRSEVGSIAATTTPAQSNAPSHARDSAAAAITAQNRSLAAEKSAMEKQSSQVERAMIAPLAAEGAIEQPPASPQASSAFANTGSARALANSSIAGVAARPHWRIDGKGQAERSLGNGAWQPVFPNESAKMQVVSVFEEDVWVGGENSRLYHSLDSGNTFSMVMLPMKNGGDHAIVHIHFQTRETGAVEAADGTSWTTTDGGVSWQ